MVAGMAKKGGQIKSEHKMSFSPFQHHRRLPKKDCRSVWDCGAQHCKPIPLLWKQIFPCENFLTGKILFSLQGWVCSVNQFFCRLYLSEGGRGRLSLPSFMIFRRPYKLGPRSANAVYFRPGSYYSTIAGKLFDVKWCQNIAAIASL